MREKVKWLFGARVGPHVRQVKAPLVGLGWDLHADAVATRGDGSLGVTAWHYSWTKSNFGGAVRAP